MPARARSPGFAPVVLLSGASQGIGRVTAGLLARSGYRVYGTSRRPAEAAPIPGVRMLALDLCSEDSIRACVQAVLEEAGRIDVLINNAGMVGPLAASEEVDITTIRSLFETNFFGVVQLTNAVLPGMRARHTGLVLNISSATGLVALPPFMGLYSASKHALEAYSEGLRHELQPLGVRVALIEPGYVRTAINESIQPPDRPIADYAERRQAASLLNQAGILHGAAPETVARAVLRVLRQGEPGLRHPSGAQAWLIWLARRFLPAGAFERLARAIFFGWRPAPGLPEHGSPPVEALGLHRFLFDQSYLPRLLRALPLAALLAAAGLRFIRRLTRQPR